MFKIKFCYWSNVDQVLAIRINDTTVINVAGYVARVARAVKRSKRRALKEHPTENNFLTRYRNAGFLSRLAVRILLVITQLKMRNRR